ncbi:MAG: hypothetical protein ACOX6W_06230 [Lentisphaeria bacterium]|jgi:hypothetical protein
MSTFTTISAARSASRRRLGFAFLALWSFLLVAADSNVPAWRELLIPAAELPRILQSWPGATMISAEDFNRLLQENNRADAEPPPVPALLRSAAHRLTVLDDRAHWECQALAETLKPGPQLLTLAAEDLTWTDVLVANQPAVGALKNGQLSLLFDGKPAAQELLLRGEIAVRNDGAQRQLSCRLPDAPSRELTVVVPGDVALRAGPPVLARQYDEKANVTTLRLIPPREKLTLTLSLNNRFKRDASLVRSVSRLDCRIGLAGEELTAEVRLLVHHNAITSWRFLVPDGFEVISVNASSACGVASWSVDANRVLTVIMQEPLSGLADFSFQLYRVRPAATTDDWAFPTFQPLDCASAVTYTWVWAERHLKCRDLASTGLIYQQLEPMPTKSQTGLQADMELITSGYAPGAFQLTAAITRPEAQTAIASDTTLEIKENGLLATALVTIMPERDTCYQAILQLPEGWKYDGDAEPLPGIDIGLPDRNGRLTVRFPNGIAPPQKQSFKLTLKSTPPGWEQDWTKPRLVDAPVLSMPAASRQSGRLCMVTQAPLTMELHQAKNCLAQNSQNAYLYTFQSLPVTLTVAVSRPAARLSAGTYTLVKVNPDHLAVTHELDFTAHRSPVREISCRLPAEAPAALTVFGRGDTVVKEHSSQANEQGRIVTALLAAEASRAAIVISYQLPLIPDGQKTRVPLVDAHTADDQHGRLAIEGEAELDVAIFDPPRPVDVGELQDNLTQPGRRLLGVYAYTGAPPTPSLTVTRQAVHALPAILIRESQAATVISPNGIAQHTVRYAFRPNLPHLNIVMPPQADLWAVVLDDEPATLQQCVLPTGDGQTTPALLLPLPPAAAPERTLVITYETHIRAFRCCGTADATLPALGYVDAEGNWVTAPAANLTWEIVTPPQYRPIAAKGNVYPRSQTDMFYGILPKYASDPGWLPEPIAPQVGRFLYACTGKITPKHGIIGCLMLPLSAVQQKARMIDKLSGDDAYMVEKAAVKSDMEAKAVLPRSKFMRSEKVTEADKPSLDWLSQEATRSLPIDLVREGRSLRFDGLTAEANVSLTLLNNRALRMFRRGVFLLLVCIGLLPAVRQGKRWRYVIGWLLASSILPCLPGLAATTLFLNDCFVAALVLAVLYALGAAGRWLKRSWRPASAPTAATSAALLLATSLLLTAFPSPASGQAATEPAKVQKPAEADVAPAPAPAQPQAPASPASSTAAAPALSPAATAPALTPVELVKPAPMPLPEDAIIVPYDGRPERLLPERLLPYTFYQRLRTGAQPPPFLPAPALFTTVKYEATLTDDDTMTITARLQAVIPAATTAPLPTLSYQNVLPGRITANGNAVPAWTTPGLTSGLAIAALPPGKHTLEMTWLATIVRQGGWRQVEIALPAPTPAILVITPPEHGAEIAVRSQHLAWTQRVEQGASPLEVAVDGGLFTLQWRLPATAGNLDDALTVESAIDLIVGESATEAAWKPNMQFRGEARSVFELSIPNTYKLLDITGPNIRGWESRPDGQKTFLTVHLLKAADKSESFKVRLLGPGVGADPKPQRIAFPDFAAPGAARHRVIARLRRRGEFDLRTEPTASVAGRIDLARLTEHFDKVGEDGEAWQSVTAPLPVTMSIQPYDDFLEADLRVVHRLETSGQTMEGKLELKTGRRFRPTVKVRFPAGMAIRSLRGEHLFAHDVETTPEATLAMLRLIPGSQDATVYFTGELTASAQPGSVVPAPVITILDADRQETALAVLCPETLQVRERNLRGLSVVLPDTVHAWLTAANRQHVRLALRARSAEYSGELLISAKPTTVTGMCAASVRFTETVQQETYLFDLHIDGGLEQFSFTAPKYLADARLNAPLLRRTRIEPEGDSGRVRFTLEFQDQLTANFRILLEHDRLPPGNAQTIVCPAADTPLKYYCVIENAGRDEVTATPNAGAAVLDITRAVPEILRPLLIGNRVQAFAIKDAQTGGVNCQVNPRTAVVTANARIGLASTTLMLTSDGLCLGETTFQIDNRTEQFLVVRLPAGAELWTVQVAGELIKPVTPADAEAGTVWIPLLKTAEGDLDYPVILKYRAQLRRPGWLRQTAFPLPETVNVNIEQTQVALRLPVEQKWLAFDGDLGQPVNAGAYHAATLTYQSNMLKRLTSSITASDDDSHSRTRAAKHAEEIFAQVQASQMQVQNILGHNEQVAQSQKALDDFIAQALPSRSRQRTMMIPTGRKQFNDMSDEQSVSLANALPAKIENWQQPAEVKSKPAPKPVKPALDQVKSTRERKSELAAPAPSVKKSVTVPLGELSEKAVGAARLRGSRANQLGATADIGGDMMMAPPAAARPPMPSAAPAPMVEVAVESSEVAPAEPLAAAAAAANLASLDVPLCGNDSSRWHTCLFSAPRDGVVLHGRAVSVAALAGWKRLGFMLLAAGLVAVLVLLVSRLGLNWIPARLRSRQTMRQAALISLVFGILPVIGVIILIASYIRIRPRA